MATFIADRDGVIAIGIERGKFHAVAHANALDGVPFAPGQTVEIDDDRLVGILDQLLAPFCVSGVPIHVDRLAFDPHGDDPAVPLGR